MPLTSSRSAKTEITTSAAPESAGAAQARGRRLPIVVDGNDDRAQLAPDLAQAAHRRVDLGGIVLVFDSERSAYGIDKDTMRFAAGPSSFAMKCFFPAIRKR